MYIETQRMLIRDFVIEDASDLYEILGNEETMHYLEPTYDFEKTKAFLTSFCISQKGAVAAICKENNKLIGYILFHKQAENVYEIGWVFHHRFLRKGYAYESCKAVIDYAFKELHAYKVFAETSDTIKSVSLMKKLGMQLENHQCNHCIEYQTNQNKLVVYELIKENWLEKNIVG